MTEALTLGSILVLLGAGLLFAYSRVPQQNVPARSAILGFSIGCFISTVILALANYLMDTNIPGQVVGADI